MSSFRWWVRQNPTALGNEMEGTNVNSERCSVSIQLMEVSESVLLSDLKPAQLSLSNDN